MAQSGGAGSTSEAVAMILAGGQGQRLYPLTRQRAKPAIRFAASYRMIDFTLSNCVNSNLKRVHLLTQYAATSLHRHIQQGWSSMFVAELGEFIDTVPPQKLFADRWYAATADAIYQNLFMLQEERPPWVFVLSGDHAYKMDYGTMLAAHLDSGAQLTIACRQLPREQCTELGVVESDESGYIVGFEEKPTDPKPTPGNPEFCLVSMGVYLWNTADLARQVAQDATRSSGHDFGRDIVPHMVAEGLAVYAFDFRDPATGQPAYWRDIGTVDSYWQTNMDLTAPLPELNLYDYQWPIYTHRGQHPAVKTTHDQQKADLEDCLIAAGCIISGARVRRSLLSPGVRLERGAEVTNSILMDDVRVGPGARLDKVIADEGVEIPPGYTIGLDPEQDSKRFVVTDSGITVVPTGAVLD